MWPPPRPIITGFNLWHNISAALQASILNIKIPESLQANFTESWNPTQCRRAWEIGWRSVVCTSISAHLPLPTASQPSDLSPTCLNTDVKYLYKLVGGGRFGLRPPTKFFGGFSRPNRKLLPATSQLRKKIPLAFLKATNSQIPHWVHFTFKVKNPIYINMYFPLVNNFIPKMKPSIKHVSNLGIGNITKSSLTLSL